MNKYLTMSKDEMRAELEQLMAQYEAVKARGLKLDMSRGKPDPTQLNLSMDMLSQNPYELIYSSGMFWACRWKTSSWEASRALPSCTTA